MPSDSTAPDAHPEDVEPVERRAELTAAGRVFAILDVFRTSHAPVTLSDISRRSGLSMTTAHRLTHELLGWQALERTESGAYQLGTKMLELGTASGTAMRLRELAMPSLVRLHQMLRGLVVHLAVRDGVESVYVEALRSGTGIVRANRLGGRLPLHVTAPGIVLLAYADAAVQERVLSQSLRAFTPLTETDPDALRALFSTIRATRTYLARSQVTMVTGGVASPVFGPDGEVIASVGIVVALEDHRLEECAPLVQATAKRISRALDFAEPELG